ncbi:endoribonuclease L-PSP [Desulfatibacillum alkenivorans DSM 16219]|jgi:2-iminobutanoate/2-iminopropanoate deaminase|uniref:Endoribonuclease L-PSP n=1 Tax=Desulfatibacillum alkenivorans DSM 16219 TaxID=1121393 RepID=A0A1M6R2B0_9BACT|nr:RidA family protein [Desulfatibacillum alkenivorans]SHK26563.1 endoribonuclease L-PSP [Desulfatibacillum alkenivorans DSM 16219]
MKEQISTDKAPAAIGPYSQAIKCNGLVFVSGQLAIDPESGEVTGDVKEQTKTVLINLSAILEAAGTGLSNVLKTTVYLDDIGDFAAMNEVYATFFSDAPPARAAFEVARLPKNALVEIEAVAAAG